VVVQFEAVDLPELCDFFTNLPTTVVGDHRGRPKVSQRLDGPEFERFSRFIREHEKVRCKMTSRISRIACCGGSDCPHPDLKRHMPDEGLLMNLIPHFVAAAELQRNLLVCNCLCWAGE
jgi:2-pyrone-4,6-dicarboxylate lactonase